MYFQHSSPLACSSFGRWGNHQRTSLNHMEEANRRSGTLCLGVLLLGLLFWATLFALLPVAHAQSDTVRFAVIGDYGVDSGAERDVADLVKSWNPDFVITLGDNNYFDGAASTIDANIGKYYQNFIFPYTGAYGNGATTNRFFPSLGNHDWITAGAIPYLDYFVLPNNERYYDFVQGPVHFFVVDSDPNEPDGNTSTSVQGNWLEDRVSNSTDPWKLVYFHHPSYSSGEHGSTPWMQWPFQQWGATAVLSGHDHDYERVILNGFPYFVTGSGGASLRTFGTPVVGSEVRFNTDHGAMLVTASGTQITFQFTNRASTLIDSYTIMNSATPSGPAVPLPLAASTSSSTEIRLSWGDNSGDEDGFKIGRCQGEGCTDFTEIAQVGPNVEAFLNTDLPANIAYGYQVRAFNAAGDSGYSNTASATTAIFSDKFNDGAISVSKWNLGLFSRPSSYFDPQVQVVEQNGTLTVTPIASLTGGHYNGYISASTWNLTGGLAAVDVPQKTSGRASTIFSVGIDRNNRFSFRTKGNTLYMESRVAGISSSVTNTYSAERHRFWRFRHDTVTDSILFETSADGVTWVAHRTVARQIALDAVRAELIAGTSESVDVPGTAQFNKFYLVAR